MFQPTSRELFYLILIFALGGFVYALRSYRGRQGIRFFGAAFLSAILFSGAAGLQINHSREYITSWTELPALIGFDQNKHIPLEQVELAALQNKISLNHADLGQYRLDFQSVTEPRLLGAGFSGQYFEAVLEGADSGVSQPVRVWAPDGWQQMHDLKVVIFLHGYPSNPEYAQESLGVGAQLGAQISKGEVEPTIVVFPQLRPDQNEPDCIDVKGHPKIGTFVLRDLVLMVQANFPVSKNREDWAISGNSAGAYCAGLLAGLFPQVFGAGIILSGYDDPQLGALKQLNSEDREKFFVSSQISKSDLPLRVYNFAAGNDLDAKQLSQRIAQVNNQRVKVTNVYDPQGSHNWKTWYRAFPDALSWFAASDQYRLQAGDNFAEDHYLADSGNWAAQISIAQIEFIYLAILLLWVLFLLWKFNCRLLHTKWWQKSSTGVILESENTGCGNRNREGDVTEAVSRNNRWREWVKAFYAVFFTVSLIGLGIALLINHKMGTISNFSNITALLQLFGF